MEKLLRLLSVLTKSEIKDLYQMFTFKKVNKTLLQLLDHLLAYHPEFAKLDQQKLADKILDTNNNPLSIKQLQTNASKLATYVEAFFAWQALEKKPELQSYLATTAFAERGLYHDFKESSAKSIHKMEDKPDADTADFYLLAEFNQQLFFHPDTEKFQTETDTFAKGLEYAEKFYLLYQLRYFADQFVRQNLYAPQKDMNLHYILELARKYDTPLLKLYAQLLLLMSNHQHQAFMEILSNLKTYLPYLKKTDKSIIIHKLIYQAYKVYEKGEPTYLHPIFELFRIAHQQDVIIYQAAMDHFLFVNAVAIASAVEEFDWAERFIVKYCDYLNKDIKKETVALAEAYLYFYKGEYDGFFDSVKELEYWHPMVRLQGETLYLRVFYEEIVSKDRGHLAFSSRAASLRQYLNRNGILSDNKKKAIKNYIRMLEKFIKYFYNINRKPLDKKKLENELQAIQPIISKSWLLTKLQALP